MRRDTRARIEAALPELLQTPQNQLQYRGWIYWADAAEMAIYGHQTPQDGPERGLRIAEISEDMQHITPLDERTTTEAQILALAAIKGGTGKTTTAAALAQAAHHAGRHVLAVDLDPQGNLTFDLGADPARPGSYELLHGLTPDRTVQATAQGIDAIAASPDLATETTSTGSAYRLRRGLEPLRGRYDLIVIDTPPQMGDLTFNALQACTGLLIPLEADRHSLDGLYQIMDIAKALQAQNKNLQILGHILTRFDSRPRLNRYLQEHIAQAGEDLGAPFLGAIRPGVAIKEAQALQRDLYQYAPASKPAQDYEDLYQSIITRA